MREGSTPYATATRGLGMNGRPVKGLDRPPGGRTERQVAAEVIVLLMEAGVIQRSPEQLAKSAEAVGIPVEGVRQAWNTRDRNGNAPPIDGQPVADGEQVNGSRTAAPSGGIEELLSQAATVKGAKVNIAAQRLKTSIETLRILVESEGAKDQARAEVERLEKQLAEAKAKLKGPGRRPGATGGSTGVSFRDVWDWAEAQGYTRKRGRPSNFLVEQYKQVHGAAS
jgi:hypothetical protein